MRRAVKSIFFLKRRRHEATALGEEKPTCICTKKAGSREDLFADEALASADLGVDDA